MDIKSQRCQHSDRRLVFNPALMKRLCVVIRTRIWTVLPREESLFELKAE